MYLFIGVYLAVTIPAAFMFWTVLVTAKKQPQRQRLDYQE